MHSVHRDLTSRFEAAGRENAEMKEKKDEMTKTFAQKDALIQRLSS